jgi:hypothetical protein
VDREPGYTEFIPAFLQLLQMEQQESVNAGSKQETENSNNVEQKVSTQQQGSATGEADGAKTEVKVELMDEEALDDADDSSAAGEDCFFVIKSV